MARSGIDTWRRSGGILVGLTLALVVAADWLFYEEPVGWTLGLYLLLLLLALAARAGRGGGVGWVVAGLLVGLMGALAWQPGPLAVLLAVVGLGVLALGVRSGWTASPTAWASRLALAPPMGVIQPLLDLTIWNRWARRRQTVLRMPWIGRWVIPVGLTLVFVGLFWLANPVIGSWLEGVTDALRSWLSDWTELFDGPRMLLWLVVAWGVWALLRVRARRSRARSVLPPPEVLGAPGVPGIPGASPRGERLLSVPTVVRCLVLFNAVFLAQTGLDLAYLWGGAELPEGMTYAEYAHRGAYPLVATALLAGAFVLWTFRAGGAAERSPWARRLVYLWLAQNLLLLVSAAWRLRLYVDAYSLTHWRVAAVIWMLLVALGLGWIIVRLAAGRSNPWLLGANALTLAAVLYACCFVNFAGGIAWFNVQRCAEVGGPGVPIDLAYLESLGPEALPALGWLQGRVPRTPTAVATEQVAERLRSRLAGQLIDWRGWTWRRAALAEEHLPTAATAPPALAGAP